MEKRFRIYVSVCIFLSVCACSRQSGDLRMPAKLDEPRKADGALLRASVEPVELIRLGNTNKGAEECTTKSKEKDTKKIYKVKATGYYTPEKGQKRYAFGSFEADLRMNGKGKMTASGKKPEAGKTVAVDKRVIPHGALLKIEGYPGIFEAQDSGKAIVGKRIDIYFGKGEKALEKALAVNNKEFITVEVVVPHLPNS